MTSQDAFRPFDNDTQVTTFTDGQGELSIENGIDAVLLAGEIEFTADAQGLSRVRALRAALGEIERVIAGRVGVE